MVKTHEIIMRNDAIGQGIKEMLKRREADEG